MIHHEIPDELSGAIFDLDDTLLDNKQGGPAGHSLHERSQLQALRFVGEKYDIPELTHVSAEESLDAFLTAPDHTHESAIWNLFIQLGLTSSKAIDFANTILAEAVEAKELLHEKILFDEGDEIPGAIDFARRLADHYDLWGRTSMASTAVRRNANIFIDKTESYDLFPHQRVFTNETVRFKKPHPEVYDRAFVSLGLEDAQRRSTLGVEDDPKGVKSVVGASLFSVAITTRFSRDHLMSLDVPPTVVGHSYAELGEIFKLPRQL